MAQRGGFCAMHRENWWDYWRRGCLRSGYRADEGVAAAGNRGDEGLTGFLLAQDLAENENGLRQVGLFHGHVQPKRF